MGLEDLAARADSWLAAVQKLGIAQGPHRHTDYEEASFEWWNDERELAVYFDRDGEDEFLKVWGPNIHTQMETGDQYDIKSFHEAWNWLMENRI